MTGPRSTGGPDVGKTAFPIPTLNGPGVYLDANATAPVRPEAARALVDALALTGNPSSAHAAGRAARAAIETARAEVAALAGASAAAVTFVSGGAEANSLAIRSALASGVTRIIIGATEHDTVRETAQIAGLAAGLPVEIWPVDADGVADLAWLARELAASGGGAAALGGAGGRKRGEQGGSTGPEGGLAAAEGATAAASGGPARPLVCLMLANNETGVIQPVAAAAALVQAAGGLLHVDAVQAAGRLVIDFAALGADTLTLSAHKIGGPQGVGALLAGPRATLVRQTHGGGQERGRRAGTENTPGIVAFGAAARAALADLPRVAADTEGRDAFEARIVEVGAVVLGAAAPRLPQTSCFAMPGYAAEMQVIGLDLAGVRVSAGAACSSGKVKASPVVAAMGRPDLAPFSIRVSGGWSTPAEDWVVAARVWRILNERRAARRQEVA